MPYITFKLVGRGEPMQKYTELKLRELSDSFDILMAAEFDKAASLASARGFLVSNVNIEDIGMKYVDKLLDDLLSAEETALLKLTTLPTSDYFHDLRDEMIQIAFGRIEAIFSRVVAYGGKGIPGSEGGVTEQYRLEMHEQYKKIYTSRIQTKIDLMQEELRPKILSRGGPIIDFSGNTAAVNAGTVYGPVHRRIEKMKGTGGTDVAELFDRLLAAIKDSRVDEEQKLQQMQNVELLVTQYETPPEKRNRGLISASMNFLAMAANLATLWAQVGPMIIEAFKKI
jgi:hypothetical protein